MDASAVVDAIILWLKESPPNPNVGDLTSLRIVGWIAGIAIGTVILSKTRNFVRRLVIDIGVIAVALLLSWASSTWYSVAVLKYNEVGNLLVEGLFLITILTMGIILVYALPTLFLIGKALFSK